MLETVTDFLATVTAFLETLGNGYKKLLETLGNSLETVNTY